MASTPRAASTNPPDSRLGVDYDPNHGTENIGPPPRESGPAGTDDNPPRAAAKRRTPTGQPEAQLWAGRTHWRYFAGRLALWALVNLVVAVVIGQTASRVGWLTAAAAAWTIGGLISLSGLVVIGGVMLRIYGSLYRLTNERLFIRRGILSQTNDQLELIRVDDVRTYKTLLGRLLDVGTVTVLTTDATEREVKIEGILKPDSVAESVRSCMRSLRGKSLFVETL